ncbi:MAG: Coenzyme F420 hydrogenase/dehydrogenase, beta subunit C-terminal domain [Clostridiales bacterium]|nr:Coenzyme F420 hydrogenase/dehydrogenase, beta subunit C-terminal domain [Clostridiales bacterium]
MMEKNKYGFVYPILTQGKCISCGLCEKVCSYNKIEKHGDKIPSVYAAVGANVDLAESASGGIFSAIAKNVLHNGGVVYGCSLVYENDRLWPKHIRVTDMEDLKLLKGSKYVQSDTGNSFAKTKQDLIYGKQVLYSGTPCQIAGLKGYLGKEHENLYTIEIICHGVPNVDFFHSYISYIEEIHDIKVTDFRFRDKREGWKLHGSISYMKKDATEGESHFEPEESSYYQMFLNSYTYRENCYSCPYASDNRQGDITIGDFWCIDLVHPELLASFPEELDEKKGISCLIINSEQGERLINQYGNGTKRWDSSYEQAAKYNAQLTHPSEMKPEREIVLNLYRSSGYAEVEKWYQNRLKKIGNRRKLVSMVPKSVKKLVRPIIYSGSDEK